MVKKDDPPVADEWTPDKPIPDEEGEAEAQRRHMMARRLKYLEESADGKRKKKDEKPTIW
jgi:hypothetical protein